MIVSTSKLEHSTVVISPIKHDNPPILVSNEIVSFDASLKDKQASSVLSEEIVSPTPWYKRTRLDYVGDDCRCLLHTCSIIGLLQLRYK